MTEAPPEAMTATTAGAAPRGGLLAPLPQFLQPRRPRLDPGPEASPETDLAGEGPSPTAPDQLDGSPGLGEDLESRPSGLRTKTSSASERKGSGDPALVADVLAVALGLALVGVGFLVSRRQGKVLRQPTDEQLDEIAEPLGRIAVRHLPLAKLDRDFLDAIAAAKAGKNYVSDGPLILATPVDPGTIPNLEH